MNHGRNLSYDYDNDGYNYDYAEAYDGNTKAQRQAEVDPYGDDYASYSEEAIYRESRRNKSHHDLFAEDSDYSHSHNRGRYHRNTRPTQQPEKIPVPNSSYLNLVEQPSVRLTEPSQARKLLVLDLNGTLLYREPRPRDGRDPYAMDEPRPLRPTHIRPCIPSLKAFLFHPATRKWLDTMVWSSAQYPNVKDMVGSCLGEEQVAKYVEFVKNPAEAESPQRDGLVAIWDRKFLGLSQIQYRSKYQTNKDLKKVWALLPLSGFSGPNKVLSEAWDRVAADEVEAVDEPQSSATSNKSRFNNSFLKRLMETTRNDLLAHSALSTILLDDSPLKARMQPFNHICVPEYGGRLYARDAHIAEARISEVINYNQPATKDPVIISSSFDDREVAIGKRKRSQSSSSQLSLPTHKKARESSPEAQDVLLKHHDHIILAVIGLIDALKHESNVAAWVKNEGLFALKHVEHNDFDSSLLEGDPEAEKILARGDEELDNLYRESMPDGVGGAIRSVQKKSRWRHNKHRSGMDSALSLRSEQSDLSVDFSEYDNDVGMPSGYEVQVENGTSSESQSSRPLSMAISLESLTTEPASQPGTPEYRDWANYSGTTTEPASPPSASHRRELARKAHLMPRPERRNIPQPPPMRFKQSRAPTPTFVDSLFLYGEDTDASNKSTVPSANLADEDQQQQDEDFPGNSGEKDLFSSPCASPPGLTGRRPIIDADSVEDNNIPSLAIANADVIETTKTPEAPINPLPPLWYQHPPTRWYWVKRGIRALHELELRVIPGVEVETD